MEISDLLKQSIEKGATDLHLTVGAPPTIRLNGSLIQISEIPLRPDDTRRFVELILGEKEYAFFEEKGEVEFSYSYPGLGRFRVNAFHQRGTMGMVIRVINTKVPKISTLGLPDIVTRMTMRPKGLILVTGPAGSGKSTTLAAMIDLINEERQCHIITLEDPIEYLHAHNKSIINQREIGSDSESFPNALRAALRQDPDVIMVGEMTDSKTIAIAVNAAETGHLVLASMHTLNASQTIERIVDAFPLNQKEQMRVQLGNTLVGIISQRLLPRKDEKGRVAAVEFLAITPNLRTMIKEGRIQQIYTSMQTGVKSGMRTLDNHLQILYEKGVINSEDAMENSTDRASMSRFMSQTTPRERDRDTAENPLQHQ